MCTRSSNKQTWHVLPDTCFNISEAEQKKTSPISKYMDILVIYFFIFCAIFDNGFEILYNIFTIKLEPILSSVINLFGAGGGDYNQAIQLEIGFQSQE